MVDIKLDTDMALTAAATGDAPTVQDTECLLQELRLEAITQEGELFYDKEFGWSLLDFMQAEDNPVNRVELAARIRTKLSKHTEINPESIEVLMKWQDGILFIQVRFRLYTNNEKQVLNAAIDRVNVEVIAE